MKDLLVAISHHSAPGRLVYLRKVLEMLAAEYECSHDVVVDTNVCDLDVKGENLTVVAHPNLEHPFFLAWCHRKHFRERIDDYRAYFYCEDDLYVPFVNFRRYMDNFPLLWPQCVPSLVRIEQMNGIDYALDVTKRQVCQPIEVAGRLFCRLNEDYCGCWAMSQDALKASMTPDFVRLSDSRETAASFPSWELGKTPLVQIQEVDGRFQIHPECFAFHISNSYCREPSSPHGKIPVEEIFVK